MNYSSVILKKTNCVICKNKKSSYLFNAKYLLFNLEGDYNVLKCNSCELIRTDPLPTINTMEYYYPKEYAPYVNTKKPRQQSKFKKKIKKFTNFFFDTKGQSIPNISVGNILDFGCASGEFLLKMKNKGWKVFGIETSKEAADYANNLELNVYHGPLEEAKKPNCPELNLIVGWMAVEHLHDPISAFKKLHTWSNKDTYLTFSIPNAESFEFNLFKKNWYALQVPTHVHHFTPKTINKILEMSGWKLEKVIYQRSVTNIIASIGHVLESFGCKRIGKFFLNYAHNPMKLNYLLYPIALILSIFKQSGRITIWAKIK